MNCPKCKSQTLADQKFCRSCGTSLQMTTQPLAEHAVSDPATAPAITPGGQQRANRLLLWSFIMMFIGVAIGVIGKKLIHDEIVTVVGVLISLAGMFLAVYPFLSPPLLRKHDSSSSQPEVLTQSQSTTSRHQRAELSKFQALLKGRRIC